MSDSNEYPAFAKLWEKLGNKDIYTLREAGLLDPKTIRYLEGFQRNYEPNTLPHYKKEDENAYWYYNTKQYVSIVRNNAGETISKAVQNGNKAVVSHFVGLDKEGSAEMDFLDYEKLADLIEKPALLLLLFGDTGSGKSFTGVRLAELWKYRVGGTVLTNIKSLAEGTEEVVFINSYVDLLRYCLNNPKERKLLLADELSSLMSGYSDDRQDVEMYMRPLERKKRKVPFRLSTIGIIHRLGDIHPTMRNGELAYFGEKLDKKQMNIYHTEDLDREYCEVGGIGLPNWSIDTDDDGTWWWGSETEILEVAKEIEEAGYGDILRLIENLEEDEEEAENIEESPRCMATTNAGDPCPNDAKLPPENPLVCKNHRHRMDKLDSVSESE